jgi:small nuclear ribonucleoprotein D1
MRLIRLLQKCRNKRVTVETKENQSIDGVILSVDKTMNVQMKDGVIDGKDVGTYTVRGSSVRYIIFREEMDFKAMLVDDRPRNDYEQRIKRRKKAP